MRRLEYSYQAARGFLAFLVIVGASAALGHVLNRDHGAVVGLLAGGVLFFAYLVWRNWRLRRGDAWVEAGRRLGLRSIYSGHAPAIPLPGHEESLNQLAGTIGTASLVVADRNERFLQYHEDAAIGTWETGSPRISDPIPIETFLALEIPGVGEGYVRMGKRRSLWEGPGIPPPDGPTANILKSWLCQHPGWRVEGNGGWLVLSRPNQLARFDQLEVYVEIARSLVEAIGDQSDRRVDIH